MRRSKAMQIPKKRTQILTISESSKEDLDVVSEYSDELDVSPNKETSKTNSKNWRVLPVKNRSRNWKESFTVIFKMLSN